MARKNVAAVLVETLAAAGVENVGLDNGSGRARVDAQTAISAQILGGSLGLAERPGKIKRGQNYAQE